VECVGILHYVQDDGSIQDGSFGKGDDFDCGATSLKVRMTASVAGIVHCSTSLMLGSAYAAWWLL
jgi:hypothetical protein